MFILHRKFNMNARSFRSKIKYSQIRNFIIMFFSQTNIILINCGWI